MSKWIQRAGIFLGVVIAGGMLFANQLGIDNNAVWGTKRILLFALGLVLLAASILYRDDNFLGRLIHTRTGQLYFASALAAGFVLLAYVWWVSLGLWSPWTPSTNYYDLMATAFRHGQLALEVEPDPGRPVEARRDLPDLVPLRVEAGRLEVVEEDLHVRFEVHGGTPCS